MDSKVKKTGNKTRIVLTVLAAVLTLCAIGTCALPLFATDFFGGEIAATGFDYMEIADQLKFPLMCIPIAVSITALAGIVALVALANKKLLIVSCVGSVAAMLLMALGIKDNAAHLAVGFAAFQMVHAVALVLHIVNLTAVGKQKAKAVPATPTAEPAQNVKTCPACGSPQGTDAPFCWHCGASIAPVQEPNPAPVPAPEQPQTCAVCGKTLIPGAKFCLGCGTRVAEAAAPAAATVPVTKNTCPKCGSEVDAGAAFCWYCGASNAGGAAPVNQTPTAPVSNPVPTPVPKPAPKPERNAICPHCGARQSSENVTCKYCGTRMR